MRLSAVLTPVVVAALALAAGPATRPATAPVSRPSTQPATTRAARPPSNLLFGDAGDARRIVFVCDVGPSMIGRIAMVKQELVGAVSSLDADQQFNVIFYNRRDVVTPDGRGLFDTTNKTKRAFFQWLDDAIDFKVRGASDPSAALTLAFGLKPDLIYWLGDGGVSDVGDRTAGTDVESVIARLAKARKVRVNTVLLDSLDDDAAKVLERVAKTNGGTFRRAREEDVGK